MRVTFDTNAWEAVFAPGDTAWAPIRDALRAGRIEGFACAAGFRIEAITKRHRPSYFAQPHMAVTMNAPIAAKDGVFEVSLSIGPDDGEHPGLPPIQIEKLDRALATGIRLLHGNNWMGLPVPGPVQDQSLYAIQSAEASSEREVRQAIVSDAIDKRGVGKARFDDADGWTDRPRTPAEDKELVRACAEWADGELVAAHIAYQNDILCTNDKARSAGRSVFDATNREWLAASFGVTCLTLDELTARVSP